jgi:hypothetical protein
LDATPSPSTVLKALCCCAAPTAHARRRHPTIRPELLTPASSSLPSFWPQLAAAHPRPQSPVPSSYLCLRLRLQSTATAWAPSWPKPPEGSSRQCLSSSTRSPSPQGSLFRDPLRPNIHCQPSPVACLSSTFPRPISWTAETLSLPPSSPSWCYSWGGCLPSAFPICTLHSGRLHSRAPRRLADLCLQIETVSRQSSLAPPVPFPTRPTLHRAGAVRCHQQPWVPA